MSTSPVLVGLMLLNRLFHVRYSSTIVVVFFSFVVLFRLVMVLFVDLQLLITFLGYLQAFLHFFQDSNIVIISNPRSSSIDSGSRIETIARFLVFLEIASLCKTAEPQVQTPECRYLAYTCF